MQRGPQTNRQKGSVVPSAREHRAPCSSAAHCPVHTHGAGGGARQALPMMGEGGSTVAPVHPGSSSGPDRGGTLPFAATRAPHPGKRPSSKDTCCVTPQLGGSQSGQFTALSPPCSGMFRLNPKVSALPPPCSGMKLRQGPRGPLGTDPEPVSYTHLTLPTIHVLCRSRWSPYH